MLGRPRVHLRTTSSTNDRARALAIAGAPHGTLVTAYEQTVGRGRQGRAWAAPPGQALLMSLVMRESPPLLSLIAGVAVCDAVGAQAALKWPNDVVLITPPNDVRPAPVPALPTTPIAADVSPSTPATPLPKLGGILVEGRPQEGWAVLGVGLNVAVDVGELPADVRERAASLELDRSAIDPLLTSILKALSRRLGQPVAQTLDAWRERDALRDMPVSWTQGAGVGLDAREGDRVAQGVAEGIDDGGRLLVRKADGRLTALDAGEVHLAPAGG